MSDMSNKLTVLLAAIAGSAGGLLSRYAGPAPVYAQTPAAIPQEIRARRFVLVDETGTPRGAFGVETNDSVQIEVQDKKGQIRVPRFDALKLRQSWSSAEQPPKELTLLR